MQVWKTKLKANIIYYILNTVFTGDHCHRPHFGTFYIPIVNIVQFPVFEFTLFLLMCSLACRVC